MRAATRKNSLTMLFLYALFIPLAAIIGIAFHQQNTDYEKAMMLAFNKKVDQQSLLIAQHAATLVTEERASDIESIFAELDALGSSELSNILIYNTSGVPLTESYSASLTSYDLQALFPEFLESLEKGKIITKDLPNYRLVFMGLRMDGSLLGYAAFSWSKESFNSALRVDVVQQLGLFALTMVAVMLAIFMMTRVVMMKPLRKTREVMAQLAAGKREVDIPYVLRRDEIGQMAKSLQVIMLHNVEKQELQTEKRRSEADLRQLQQKQREELVIAFRRHIQSVIDVVSDASMQLRQAAQIMASAVGRANEKTISASEAAKRTTDNVRFVAGATKDMSKSVNEMAGKIADSGKVVKDAVHKSEIVGGSAHELTEAASNISDIIQLINAIAGKINLLALNATIESVRAGEAGKGFAVVAQEVKNLATQTTEATGEIADRISHMQHVSDEVVAVLDDIRESISRVSEVSNNVLSVVDQQHETTNTIVSNIMRAASSTEFISENMDEVNEASHEANKTAAEVLDAANNLAEQSERLESAVASFVSEMLSADDAVDVPFEESQVQDNQQ